MEVGNIRIVLYGGVYHVLLMCFFVYITTQINRLGNEQAINRHLSLESRTLQNELVRKFKQIHGETLLNRESLNRFGSNQNDMNIKEIPVPPLKVERKDFDSVAQFRNFIRRKRSTVNTSALQAGLFVSLKNKSYEIKHEAFFEELLPDLITLEGIVIREAQKTNLYLQRLNIRLRDLEKTVTVLKDGEHSNSETTTDSSVEDGYTVVPLTGNSTEAQQNATEVFEVTEGSGEVEVGYVTVNPQAMKYNATYDYMSSLNTGFSRLYKIIEGLESQVSEYRGFKARSEVEIKNLQKTQLQLEDLINDEQRKLRQVATQMSYHRSRMTVLDNKLGSIDGSEIRLGARLTRMEDEASDLFYMLDEQKETLDDFKRQMYKQGQTIKDLEGADSVHERDTRTLQQNMVGLQQMMARIYETVDSSVDDLRLEINSDVNRLCFNNNLIC